MNLAAARLALYDRGMSTGSRLLLGLAALALSASVGVHDADAAAPRVHLTGRIPTGRTLVVDGPGGARAVLSLPPWATVERLVVSPSGRHAFMFAQLAPHQTRTAYVVDLAQLKVSATYQPGLGGEFLFSATDNVVQIAGCGTSCATLAVRDPSGKTLGSYGCDGVDTHDEISPDRRFAACFGFGTIQIVDLATGQPVLSTKTPCTRVGQREPFRWEGPTTARFVCYDDEISGDMAVAASWAGGRVELTKYAIHAP